MEIFVTQAKNTNNLNKEYEANITIKDTLHEAQVLKDAADICDSLRLAFNELEIFDYRIAERAYESLLELADIIEDYKAGDKCGYEKKIN